MYVREREKPIHGTVIFLSDDNFRIGIHKKLLFSLHAGGSQNVCRFVKYHIFQCRSSSPQADLTLHNHPKSQSVSMRHFCFTEFLSKTYLILCFFWWWVGNLKSYLLNLPLGFQIYTP